MALLPQFYFHGPFYTFMVLAFLDGSIMKACVSPDEHDWQASRLLLYTNNRVSIQNCRNLGPIFARFDPPLDILPAFFDFLDRQRWDALHLSGLGMLCLIFLWSGVRLSRSRLNRLTVIRIREGFPIGQ